MAGDKGEMSDIVAVNKFVVVFHPVTRLSAYEKRKNFA